MTEVTEGAAEAVAEPIVESEIVDQVEGQTDEQATEGEDQGEKPAPKPKKSAQERIDELTEKRRQAERDAEYWREMALKGQPQGTQPTPAAAPQQADPGEPNPADYQYGETDAAFIRDHATFHAIKSAREQFEAQHRQTTAQQAVQAFNTRVTQTFPDGEPQGVQTLRQIAQRGQVPESIGQILTLSEAGPQLANHLGSNPAELSRISALPEAMHGYELAMIAARITAPQPKTVTTAPTPAPVTRGAAGRFAADPATSDFAAFEKLADGMLTK